jgi:hypothetical protein
VALLLIPFAIVSLSIWSCLALLTAVGSWRRGESTGRAWVHGFAFPVTWVIGFVDDNHRAVRTACRSQ